MNKERKKRLAVGLTVAMVIAMIMGPGPGLRLINPDVNDPGASYLFWGIPVVYAWGILWFVVQMVIVVTAYYTVWDTEEEVNE